MARIREPVVAGQFYEGRERALTEQIEGCFRHELGPGDLPQVNSAGERKIIGLVSPHAGLMYSGPAAACGFSALASDGTPEKVIIIGPKHHLMGESVAVSLASAWSTPLGEVKVDLDLAQAVIEASDSAAGDDSAHALEHSLEVQLPFLQYLYGDSFQLVAIALEPVPWAVAQSLGQAITQTCQGLNVVIVASTDFTHHQPQQIAERNDRLALDCILALDGENLLRTVQAHHITMCGAAPTAAMLAACREPGRFTACQGLGAKSAELLNYYTSGNIIGDYQSVVGYGSVSIRR